MNNPSPKQDFKRFAMFQVMALSTLGNDAFLTGDLTSNAGNYKPQPFKDMKPIKKGKRKKKGNYFTPKI